MTGRRIYKHCLPVLLGLVALLLPASSSAATIAPTITTDEYSNPTPDTGCSLREAVASIDGGSDFGGCIASGTYGTADTIRLPAGNYALTIVPTGSNDNASGDLSFAFKTVTVEALP